MRIVFLSVTGTLGGAERLLLTLLRELRRLRPDWELTVIAADAGPLLAAAEALGCTALVLPFSPRLKALGDWGSRGTLGLVAQLAGALPHALPYKRRLRRKLELLRPDVIQTNGFKMHILGALAVTPGAALVWHVHDFVSSRRVMKSLLRRLCGSSSHVVAISESVAADLGQVLKTHCAVRTIWNSVDLNRFKSKGSPLNDIPRIGLVAAFARWKGQAVFLRALALLPAHLRWHGFVVGGDLYGRAASQWTEPELRELAAQLGIESRVEFTGFLEEPAPFMQSLDIVVHASTEPEPFGLVIAEAMAAGRAVITSSECMVTDGVDGLLHRRGDAASLAQAMERLILDPQLRERLGAAGHNTAGERFRPDRMAREFIELYESPR